MDSAIQNTSKKKHNRGYKINIQSHEIKVERYIVPIPKEESSQGITKRGEILEKAWREINALDGFDQEDGGIEVRRDGEDIGRCAVISRGEDGVGLWVFGGEAGIEGLTRKWLSFLHLDPAAGYLKGSIRTSPIQGESDSWE